ncbi:MAG TPA: disulfide bond formation protein B [Candidatus Paceibacterota bacterium]
MTSATLFLNKVLSVFTVAGDIFLVIIALIFILKWVFGEKDIYEVVAKFFYKHGLWMSFLIVIATMLGSLYYSEIANFEPCKLCWLSRIFMFPQVVLLGIALSRNDRGIAIYSMALSVLGLLISVNQNLLQWFNFSVIPCSVNALAPCNKLFIFEFGFVTIPLMALTSFALLIVLMWFAKEER